MPLPPWPLLLLWIAFVCQSWISVGLARKYLRLFRFDTRHDYDHFKPHATVIVPFKGVDADLAAGVRGLCEQDYPDYELLLVVDSQSDPAHDLLRRELTKYPRRKAEILIAGEAGPNEGQKIHNQLFALGRIYDTAAEMDAWVFADSDAIPGPQWLRGIIGPLAQEKRTGVTTGYRWLIPQQPATFWSQMASLMNGTIAGMMGNDDFNHAWGGSMAILALNARKGDLRGRLVGALCDDYQFTRLAGDLGLRVYFVPGCLVATPVNFDRRGFANFVHRQYLLTRVYAPMLFTTALAFTTLYAAGFLSLVTYLVICAIHGGTTSPWPWPLIALVLAIMGDLARSSLRRRAIHRAFGDAVIARLRTTLLLDRWATPLWMLLHWLMIVRSVFGRTMRWRGILYRLDAPQKCQRLS